MNKYICLYWLLKNIKIIEQMQIGSKKSLSLNAIYVFLIFASWSSWCDNETPIEDCNKIINSSEKIENIINAIHINSRTYKRVIKELLDAEFIYEIKKDTYYINPYICYYGR